MTQLNPREKTLTIIVGSALFLFVNYFVYDYFAKRRNALTVDLARQTAQLRLIKSRADEKPKWEQREAWLNTTQPRTTNESTAGVQMLDRVKELASRHDVVVENPVIRPAARKSEYTAIGVDVETRSPWQGLIGFLGELQQPEQFVVLEKANFKIDSADATQMKSRFTVMKWYAPAK